MWKQKQDEIRSRSELTILKRDVKKLLWEVKRADTYYTASIDGIKLELTKHEGTKESFGGKTLLARHFLEKEKWQKMVEDDFGHELFTEIYSSLKLQYAKYRNESNK